jgi:hypothetical protein
MAPQQLELIESPGSVAAPPDPSGDANAAPSSAAESPSDNLATSCPRCGSTESWGRGSWCPDCGYYPGLMTLEEGSPPPKAKPKATSLPDTYWAMLKATPLWVPVLFAGIAATFGVSLYANLSFSPEDPRRFYWTIAQLSAGLIAFAAAQVIVFFSAIPTSDHFAPFDLFLKPFEIWKPTLRNLSKRPWPLWQAAWGLTAAICAVTMVGGVRYGAVFETKGARKSASAQVTRGFFSSESSSTSRNETGRTKKASGSRPKAGSKSSRSRRTSSM